MATTFIEICRKITKECQHDYFHGVMVDLYTASAVIKVYEALNDVNKAKFASCDYKKIVSITWKLIK